MSKVTMKSTKQEIFNRLLEVEKELEQKDMATMTTKDIEARKSKKEKVEKANNLVGKNILNETIVEEYNALIETKEAIETEIKDLYDIKASAYTLEALKIVHNEELEKFKEQKSALQEEIKNAQTQIERERDEEEKEYVFQRNKKRKEEERKYETQRIEKELKLQDREKAVAEREQAVKDKEKEYQELTDKVASLTTELDVRFAEGKDVGKKEADKSNAFEKRAMENKHNAEVEKLENKIEILESSLATEKERNNTLSEKLDKAYEKINNTALEVAKNSGTKVIDNSK